MLVNLILILAVGLGACAVVTPVVTTEEQPQEEAQQEEVQEEGAETASEPAEGEGAITIAYIPQNSGNPYFERIHFGFQQACEELGCEVIFTAPATAEATAQIPFIQEQVQRGIDILAIQANSVDALNTIFDEVREDGVPIIATNADITGNEEHRDAAVLAVDFDTLGKDLLELVGEQMGFEGTFAILSATTDAPAQKHWIEDPGGIKDLLENDSKYADMELLEVAYGDDVPEKSLTECEGLLAKYPEMDAILAPTTVALASAAQCVESAGVYPGGPGAQDGGIIVTGTGTPNQMRRFLKDGVIPNFLLWDPADIGYSVAHMAVGIENDEIELGEGNTYEAGRLGEMTFGPNNLVIVGPPFIFTEENVDEFDF
jgi:rhamnose transport system substrate-binding protein